MKDQTLAIHAGFKFDPATKATTPPIYQTVAYEFDDAQHGADLFNLQVEGNIYTRIMNPTTAVLEQRCAELEQGIAALGLDGKLIGEAKSPEEVAARHLNRKIYSLG